MNTDEGSEKRPRMTLRVRLLICLLFFGPAVYFKIDGDYVAAAVCVISGIGAFSGYRVGAIYIFTLLAGAAAAIAVAPSIGMTQEARLTDLLGTTGLTNRLLMIGIVGLLITMLVTGVLISIFRRFIKDRPGLENADRWIGFAVGAAEGVVAIALFLGGMLVLEPIERERADRRDPADTRGQLVSRLILRTSESTRESRLGPTMVTYNPVVLVPQLNKVQQVHQSVQVLSDPAKIQGLLHQPSIRQLQQRPEVQRLVDTLTADPEIQQILQSGKPMDRSMAMTLLNHPAVLELIDQPGFVEEASKVILQANELPAESKNEISVNPFSH